MLNGKRKSSPFNFTDAFLDMEMLNRTRTNFPSLKHKRLGCRIDYS